jgi:hypothetical protein
MANTILHQREKTKKPKMTNNIELKKAEREDLELKSKEAFKKMISIFI